MSKQSEAVARWRKNTKRKIVSALGGKCCVCGYAKYDGALEFHHIDPSTKDFHWGKINGNIRSWDTIIQEMEKCVCVCSNCHKEVHAGMVTIPNAAQRFDSSLIPPELLHETSSHDVCPVCGEMKLKARRTCSVRCANKRKQKIVDWDSNNVIELMQQYKTYTAVGEILGVTGAAIARRYKRVMQQHGSSIPE